jgi:hypothetical protein
MKSSHLVKLVVVKAHAVSVPPLLREVAAHAALKAKYSPPTLCGRSVKVAGSISYTFAL